MVTSMGYAFFFESLFLLHRNGFSIAQVPIVLPARTYGHSKMSFWEPYRSLKQLVALFVASRLNPAQFQLTRPVEEIKSALAEAQEWDSYWERKKQNSRFAYDVVATLYRVLVLKRRLTRVIRRHFASGAHLLHAGCGSGQVDEDLQDLMKITAVDSSVPALWIYQQNNPRAHRVAHASVLDLPFEDGVFDGVYNLDVVEHFAETDIRRILAEMRRVLKPGGKVVLFWPHTYATSVWFLKLVHWVLNDLLRKEVRLHLPEVSLFQSRSQAESLLRDAALDLVEYRFGPADGFVQAVVVAQRSVPTGVAS